jgi:hypothetical protein
MPDLVCVEEDESAVRNKMPNGEKKRCVDHTCKWRTSVASSGAVAEPLA